MRILHTMLRVGDLKHAIDFYSTLTDLAREFRVSRERVRQIEAQALEQLRGPRCAPMLKEFLDETFVQQQKTWPPAKKGGRSTGSLNSESGKPPPPVTG